MRSLLSVSNVPQRRTSEWALRGTISSTQLGIIARYMLTAGSVKWGGRQRSCRLHPALTHSLTEQAETDAFRLPSRIPSSMHLCTRKLISTKPCQSGLPVLLSSLLVTPQPSR